MFDILICTMPERKAKFDSLVAKLQRQIGAANSSSIIRICEHPKSCVGAKMRALVDTATKEKTNEYIAFIDDDDDVADDYVASIENALKIRKTDLVTFNLAYHNFDTGVKQEWFFNTETEDPSRPIRPVRRMLANHLCVWRTDIANRVPFMPITALVDYYWYRPHHHFKFYHSHLHIDKTLYFYMYSGATTIAQKREHYQSTWDFIGKKLTYRVNKSDVFITTDSGQTITEHHERYKIRRPRFTTDYTIETRRF